MTPIMRFIKDDNGADLVEYALLVGLVALAAIPILGGEGGVAQSIIGLFNGLAGEIGGALGPATP